MLRIIFFYLILTSSIFFVQNATAQSSITAVVREPDGTACAKTVKVNNIYYCVEATCGNGIIDTGEDCDVGNPSQSIAPNPITPVACSSLSSSTYTSGNATCLPNCHWNVSQCKL